MEGLVTLESRFGPKETMDRLEAEVRGKGMQVFARIDHAGGATAAGLTLRPTEVLVFGNAKGGTPLMVAVQTMGLDLPLKVLVWEDEAGVTHLSFNDPHWLASRYGVGAAVLPVVDKLRGALDLVTKAAASA